MVGQQCLRPALLESWRMDCHRTKERRTRIHTRLRVTVLLGWNAVIERSINTELLLRQLAKIFRARTVH
jgi:hypothetical protein